MQCTAITTRGKQCKLNSFNGNYCHIHNKISISGRNVKTIDVIESNYYSVLNDGIEALPFNQGSGKRKHNRKKVSGVKVQRKDGNNIQIEKKERSDPLILTSENECQCCLEFFKASDIMICTRASKKYQHTFCKECIAGYLENLINEKKHAGCMMSTEGCNGTYLDNDIKKSLTDDSYLRYNEYVLVDTVASLASTLDNYHICPFCSKYGMIVDNLEQIPVSERCIKCCQCRKEWCITCRKESHVNEPCNKLKYHDIESIRKIVDTMIDEAVIHKCPKCFTKYNKDDGCNLMTCPSCGTSSCYVCNISIVARRGTKYWHFKGSGFADSDSKCPLFNGSCMVSVNASNLAFNNQRVMDNLTHLLNANKDNKLVLKALTEDIKSRNYVVSRYPKLKVSLKWTPCNCIIL